VYDERVRVRGKGSMTHPLVCDRALWRTLQQSLPERDMRGRSPGTYGLGILALLVSRPQESGAQVWLHLPNGGVGYVVDYTTTGWASGSQFISAGSCGYSGNALVLNGGGSSMSITFEGVTGQVTAKSNQPTQVKLGTFRTTMSGTGSFQFPQTVAPNAPYLFFTLLLRELTPAVAQGSVSGGYLRRPGVLKGFEFGIALMTFKTVAPPPGANYGEFSFGKVFFPDLLPEDAEYDVTASVNLSPEPATWSSLHPE
jgi:hypothetical protein